MSEPHTQPQSAPKAEIVTVTNFKEIDLLEAVLAATVAPSKPVEPPKVDVWPDQLLAELATVTIPKADKPAKATAQQIDLIKRLREKALTKGGLAAEVAKAKCENTEVAAMNYITELQDLLDIQSEYKPESPKPAPFVPRGTPTTLTGRTFARAGLDVTAKQWGYISHLRNRMRAINTAETRALASTNIKRDRKQASLYIGRMIQAAKGVFQATKPKTGTIICSVCWEMGCNVGPMVPYNG